MIGRESCSGQCESLAAYWFTCSIIICWSFVRLALHCIIVLNWFPIASHPALSCLCVCVCVCTDLISTPHLTPFCGIARIRCIVRQYLWCVPLIRSHDWTACRRHISIYCIWATARPTFDLLMMRGKGSRDLSLSMILLTPLSLSL